MFEITRTICSKSERSEQYLKQNAFLTYFGRFLRSNTLEQLELKLEKIIKVQKHDGKDRKNNSTPNGQLSLELRFYPPFLFLRRRHSSRSK